jgi:Leucine-rich repeat (LRR) protein
MLRHSFHLLVRQCIGTAIALGSALCAIAQDSAAPLWSADMPIDELMAKVRIMEVPIFLPDSGADLTYLPNGLRKSTILEQERWTLIRDEVEVERVRIIFSKYPLRNGVFEGHRWLTRERLIELFRMDAELNRDDIEWEVVLHTDCRNDRQVATLFHGIEILHRPKEEPVVEAPVPTTTEQELPPEELLGRMAVLSPGAVDVALPMDDQAARLLQRLDSLAADTNTVRNKADETERLAMARVRLEQFQYSFGYGGDSVVWKVLERHPEWKQVVVVADWTGSMYGYGAQALQWHVNHFERSGLAWFTLFNDGDHKPDHKKKIGDTGGLYDQRADNVEAVIALYQAVMLKGSGGDGPENPVEALLHAMELYPEAGEFVLIADNNACVRDMELLDLVDVPVRVVVCGTQDRVNEQLLEIALRSKGSLHTMEEDLHNANVERNKRGVPIRFPDLNLKFAKPHCPKGSSRYDPTSGMEHQYRSLDKAVKEKDRAQALDLSNTPLERVPRSVGKLRSLLSLKMNKTGIGSLEGRLRKNEALRVLELDNNALTELPGELAVHRFLVRLSARGNRITRIAPELASLQFLKQLDLSDNPLGELPDRFPGTRIEELTLANTGISAWPSVIRRMRRLKQLDLSGNGLSTVTLGPSLPRVIEVLDLSNCGITEVLLNGDVPPTLRVLDLSGNAIPAEAMERVRQAMPKVKVLG